MRVSHQVCRTIERQAYNEAKGCRKGVEGYFFDGLPVEGLNIFYPNKYHKRMIVIHCNAKGVCKNATV